MSLDRLHGVTSFALPLALASFLSACDSSGGSGDTRTDAPGDTGMDVAPDPDPGMNMEMDEEVAQATCADFCAENLATCTGMNAQFAGQAPCEATCATWPTGTPGSYEGNTLNCRASHLEEISSGEESPDDHCGHTGPGGGGLCGTLCDEYCADVLAACTGANQVYPDDAACRTACATFPNTGSEGDATGDTIQCRITHVLMAKMDPATHCAHVGAASPVCQ